MPVRLYRGALSAHPAPDPAGRALAALRILQHRVATTPADMDATANLRMAVRALRPQASR